MAVEDDFQRLPHYAPSPTGYAPQTRTRTGDTYSHLAIKTLVDPAVCRTEKIYLSDRSKDTHQILRPPQREIDIVSARFREGDIIYNHPTIPGLEGFIPWLPKQRYTVAATEALSELERLKLREREALLQPYRLGKAERGQPGGGTNIPLVAVRPERVAVIKKMAELETAPLPPRHSPTAYYMEVVDPTGSFRKGVTRYGEDKSPFPATSSLCDTVHTHKFRRSVQWAPATRDPPLELTPGDLYHKHLGLLPGYRGHIPGQIHRCGNTFGNDSRDAMRWLRGDFAIK